MFKVTFQSKLNFFFILIIIKINLSHDGEDLFHGGDGYRGHVLHVDVPVLVLPNNQINTSKSYRDLSLPKILKENEQRTLFQ